MSERPFDDVTGFTLRLTLSHSQVLAGVAHAGDGVVSGKAAAHGSLHRPAEGRSHCRASPSPHERALAPSFQSERGPEDAGARLSVHLHAVNALADKEGCTENTWE